MTWHAIRVAPQRETAVAAALKVKGYTFFIPTEGISRRTKRGKGPRITIMVPMFPSYIFIKAPCPYYHVKAERHVLGFVEFDGAIGTISDSTMDRLIASSGQMRPDVSVNKQRALKTGDMAKISSGPFTGHVVKVMGLHGTKAKIFLNLFNTRKAVEIAADQLEVA